MVTMDLSGLRVVFLSAPDRGFTAPSTFTGTSTIISITEKAITGRCQHAANIRPSIGQSFMETRCMMYMVTRHPEGTSNL